MNDQGMLRTLSMVAFAWVLAGCSGAAAPDGGPGADAGDVPDARALLEDGGRAADGGQRTDSRPPIDSGPSMRRVIWASDWSTALGMTPEAETDGDRWDIHSDPGDGLEVVLGLPLGFPTANALAVTAVESAGGYARLAVTGLGIPENGESRWYRWFMRHEIGSTGDDGTHPIEPGGLGVDLDWSFNVEVQSDTTWLPQFRPGGDTMDANRARWSGPALDTSVVYRFEIQIEKVDAMQFHAHVRVFDAAGVLLYDDDDFDNYSSGLGATEHMTLADMPDLHFAAADGPSLDGFRAGNNGLADMGYGELLYAYQAGFAVCADDWCGPYVEGEGR